jgi:hypothetical protein
MTKNRQIIKNIDEHENSELLEQDRELDKMKSTVYINFVYDKVYITFYYLKKTVTLIVKVSYIYLLWILFHYIASQLYIKLCVPSNLLGFLISPFLTATPQCQGLRWVIYNGADIINNMWVVLGTWLCSNVFIFNKIK